MFMIYGGGTEFQQWEQGKMLTNEHMAAGDCVVFRQGSGKTVPVTARQDGGEVVVDVPNELLMNHANIVVDLKHRPSCRTHFKVNKCACPDGYKPIQNIPEPTPKGGASSWNDLKDKPFYTETVEEVVVPETTIELPVNYSNKSFGDDVSTLHFTVGQTYFVCLNGVRYECTAFDTSGSNAFLIQSAVGNPAITKKGEDNGLPFALWSKRDADSGLWYLYFERADKTESATYTITVTTMVEKAHTLEPKYLPCDLMFKVGCTGTAHPKYDPASMTKPTIVSGSLEAVLEKMANGEIPVVKVQYQGFLDGSFMMGYGAEFTCDTHIYGTDVMFAHEIPSLRSKQSVQITMSADDPSFIEMLVSSYATSPSIVEIS